MRRDGVSIYIVGFGCYVKIGSSKNVTFRLSILQSYSPETLAIYGCMDWPNSTERLLHRYFKDHHLRGEWFRKEGELARWIAEGCPPLTPTQIAATRKRPKDTTLRAINCRQLYILNRRDELKQRRLERRRLASLVLT
jgi:Meiotically up-regulated gene 113